MPNHCRRRASDASALQVAQASVINRAMQQLILQCPQQYLWGYNRYKGPRSVADAMKAWAARALLALLWLLHWLPLGVQAALGSALGRAALHPGPRAAAHLVRAMCSCACPN